MNSRLLRNVFDEAAKIINFIKSRPLSTPET